MWKCPLILNTGIVNSYFKVSMIKTQLCCSNKCGYLKKYEELAKYLKETHPKVKVNGFEGRRGNLFFFFTQILKCNILATFEVSVNGTLVHSKLSTLAYPDFKDLSNIIRDMENGKPIRACKQQPITDCVIS